MLWALWDQFLPYVTQLWARRWFRYICYLALLAGLGGVLESMGILGGGHR
jgi:hypothetical protein